MRKVYTINSQVEFHEISNDGVILNIKAFQYGVLHYQIKNGKVVFYSNADENPWRNEVWSVDMPVTINDEVYSTADEVAEALSAVMNDSYQEQLDALQTAIDNEQARATNAEDVLDSKIDLEIQNRINAVSGLTERVADDEASTGAALVDLNNKINAVSGENASQNVQISGLTNSINTEISRATSVENALRSDLTNETSARTNADAAMLERIVAVEVGKADANNVYTKLESDNKYATKDYISGLTDEFQEKLVAGENITISGNVISAVGGGGGITPEEVQEMIDESISGKADSDDVYTKSEVDASQLAQNNNINAISGDVQTLNEKVDTISGTVETVKQEIITISGDSYSKSEVDTKLGNKADLSAFTAHTANTTVHVTAQDKTNWNNKSDFSGNYNDLTDKPTIPSLDGYATEVYVSGYTYDKQTIDDKIAQGGTFDPTQYYNKTATNALLDLKADTANTYTKSEVNGLVADKADTTAVTQVNNAVTAHTANTTVHVTASEKSTWNAKSDFSGNYNDLTNKPTIHTYTAGTGIDITNDVISVTGGTEGITSAQCQTLIDNSISGKTNQSDFTAHTANTTVHITSAERTSWDAKPSVWCGDETAWSQISGSTQSGTIYLVY